MAVPLKRKWLYNVAGIKVERIGGVRRLKIPADLSVPPKAVLHSTEGYWEGSLSVFRRTGTPTLMVGRSGPLVDGRPSGRIRIAQFMPFGEMTLTLTNPPGGVETNRHTRAQIEVVDFSLRTYGFLRFMRADPELANVVAKLVKAVSVATGVPHVHAGKGLSILGAASEAQRVSAWKKKAGWYAHSETPENVSRHWDVGAFAWQRLFNLATPQYRWVLQRGGKIKARSGIFSDSPMKRYDQFMKNSQKERRALAKAGGFTVKMVRVE